MEEPGGNGNGGDDLHGTKSTRDGAPDPYEEKLAAEKRESNPPEEEPSTRPCPYASAATYARELERRVTVCAGP